MIAEQGVLIHEPKYDGNDQWYQDDRMNVTKLHRELQHRALKWLANRSRAECYGSVEVTIAGCQADALAVTRPNSRFLDEASTDRWYDTMVVLFEAKASRSDFLSTFGGKADSLTRLNPPGTHRFLVKPRNVAMPTELLSPEWGVLEASGRGLRCVKKATRADLAYPEAHIDALFAILHYGNWGKRQLHVSCPDCAGDKAVTA